MPEPESKSTFTSRFIFISQAAYFSLAMILISGSLISVLMYQAIAQFRSRDRMPELISLIPDTMAELGENPGVATVGLFVKEFSEFNFLTNQFTFSGILWFLFDPAIISVETLSKFSFEKGDVLYTSPVSTRIVKGKLLARYDIRVKLKSNPTYALFPFDSHVVYITMDNNYVTPGEIMFKSSNNEFTISPEIAVSGWKTIGTRVYAGYSVSRIEKTDRSNDVYHPRVVFCVDFSRSGLREALTIFLPLILIFFMALFTFILSELKTVLALSSGAVTALIAYRFVIENLSPKVGYFMLSDYVFFYILALTILVFFINVGWTNVRNKLPLIAIMHALLVAGFFYLLRF
jgi:hypothetical protein